MPPTRSPGPYALAENEIAVPPYVEQLGADIYRKAFQRGWQEFGYQVGDEESQKNLEAEQKRLGVVKTGLEDKANAMVDPKAAIEKAAIAKSVQKLETDRTDIQRRLDKRTERLGDIGAARVPEPDEVRGGIPVPGYGELCERVEALYTSGYVDGWEANALAYIRRERNKNKP